MNKTPESQQGGGSLFSSLAPQPSFSDQGAPVPPQSPQALPEAVVKRIEELEARQALSAKTNADQRIFELEKRLQETQQKAIEAVVALREREVAQNQARGELEAVLKDIATSHRSEEMDKQMRARIKDLEDRLLENASATKRVEDLFITQKVALARIDELQSRIGGAIPAVENMKSSLAELKGVLSRGDIEGTSLRMRMETLALEIERYKHMAKDLQVMNQVQDDNRKDVKRIESEIGWLKSQMDGRIEVKVTQFIQRWEETLRAQFEAFLSQERDEKQKISQRVAILEQAQQEMAKNLNQAIQQESRSRLEQQGRFQQDVMVQMGDSLSKALEALHRSIPPSPPEK